MDRIKQMCCALICMGVFLMAGTVVWAEKPSIMTHFTSVWVGDLSQTASVTPGENDLFVYGTSEFEGAARFDGAVDLNSTVTIGNSLTWDGTNNYMDIPEMSAPGNPASDTGRIYVADVGTVTSLFFKDSGGTATNLLSAGGATLWDDIGNPDANDTITFGTYTAKLTSATTAADFFTFEATAAFGDISVVKIEQNTGNATNGTLLELVLAAAETDPDFLSCQIGGAEKFNIDADGKITAGAVAIDYTDFDVSADGVITLASDGSPAAMIVLSPSAAATTGLDASDANLTNAISVGANAVIGTTGIIDYTNFDVDASGNVTCGDITASGTLSAGTSKQDSLIPASASPQAISLNGGGAGAVNIGNVSTGAVSIGSAASGITLASTVTVSDTKDVTIGEGALTIDNDQNETALTVDADHTDTGSAIAVISDATSGKSVSITADSLTSGSVLYLDATEGAGFTGYYILAYDGTANDFAVKRHGEVEITGSASADMLTITAGDVQLTAGDIDLDNGQLMVDTDQDLSNNISRNYNGIGSAAVLVVNDDHTASTNIALDINQDGTGASTAVRIVHDGDSPVIDVSAGAARDGDVLSIAMANMLDERAIYVSGAITGAAGEGVIEVHATGVIPATATLLRLDADTAQPGDGDGYMMNIDDDTLVVATPNKYAVLIDSNANEALHVATGKSLFDEMATFTSGVDIDSDLDIDFSASSEEMSIETTATDYDAGGALVTIHGDHAGNSNAAYLFRLVYQTNGDPQDNFILCQDNSTGAANDGDDMFKVDSGGATSALGGLSTGSATDSWLHTDTVELSNADIKALRATKKELIAAPGANNFIEVVSVVLILEYGSDVLTESTDNLVVQYGTSGDDITDAIEMTGFIDQAADTTMIVRPLNPLPANAASDMANNSVELFNIGNGEFGGNGTNDSTMTVKITYRIHADGL